MRRRSTAPSRSWRRHSLRRAALLAGCLLAAAVGLAVIAGPLDEAVRVRVFGSLVDVRPGTPPPSRQAATGASLLAARNEFESFQVAVESEGSPVGDVSVAADGALVGPGGARLAATNLTIYREAYYDVRTPSDREGAPGPWPDPLIPTRDYLYGERRNAFPAGASAGGDVVAWIDAFVPARQRAGTYRGAVAVSVGGEPSRAIRVRLRVLPFSLPSTPTLRSAFPMYNVQACEALSGTGCAPAAPRSWIDQYLFARAALENRLTIPDPIATGPQKAPAPGAQTRLFRRYELPLITGASRSAVGGPTALLRGARLTSVEARGAVLGSSGGSAVSYWCASPRSPCLRRWRALASRYGFARRLFVYLCDEPWVDPSRRWPVCRRAARGVEASAWPKATKLVTTWIQDARENHATGLVDAITVPVDQMADKPGYVRAGDQRRAYAAFLRRPRRSLWLYTFCDQYGCRPSRSPGRYWTGWPGYGIDQPPSQARAMGWLAFDYRASGELYYNVVARLPQAWDDSYQFGGNGDGTLFYPGLPTGDPATGAPAIGGVHPIPIESIRLKRIRDGREDYEYLRLAARGGRGREAMAIVRGLLGSRNVATYGTTFGQRGLDAARCRVARLVDPAVGGCH